MQAIKAFFDAVGGPATPTMGSDGYMKTPTPAGAYRVASIGRHVSKWKYPLSKIPWGTKLIQAGGRFAVDLDGKRQDVEKLTGASAEWVLATYKLLYKKTDAPKEWLFNDFGHLTVYLYRDKDEDGRWDKSREPRIDEFIHTTPNDEASEYTSRAKGMEPSYDLQESHGCVHVRPTDIDTAVKAGYLKPNQPFVVHPYSVRYTKFRSDGFNVGRPFEAHFYPGIRKLVIVGVQRVQGSR